MDKPRPAAHHASMDSNRTNHSIAEAARRIISFVEGLERLKSETRHAWTSTGRHESIAEHSWRVAMFALALGPEVPEVDMERVVRILLVHDLGEALEGDVSAKHEVAPPEEKLRREEEAMRVLLEPLDESAAQMIMALWREYNEGATGEARIAKALDKLETIIQHNQGANPGDFDYEFNLQYGTAAGETGGVLGAIRAEVDRITGERAAGS